VTSITARDPRSCKTRTVEQYSKSDLAYNPAGLGPETWPGQGIGLGLDLGLGLLLTISRVIALVRAGF